MFVKLLLLALAGSAAAAPTLDRSHDQQPIWQHKVLHAWFCNHHPNSRWCQARGSPPAPPPTLSPKLLGGVGANGTPFQPCVDPVTCVSLQDAVRAWCQDATYAEKKYGEIALWDVSAIIDMGGLFYRLMDGETCNPDISKWDTGKVTNMKRMFEGATSFDRDLSKWDTGNVTDMSFMFANANSFSADLSEWDTGKVTNMHSMFDGAKAFSADLSRWNTGSVTNFYLMFHQATSFAVEDFCPQRFWFWPRVPLVCPYQPGA